MLRDSGSEPHGGVNRSGLRDHNERLILSLIQRHGALPASELARRSGLSPQAISVILKGLEDQGVVLKGEPIRGQVGKPRVPMRLAPDGVLGIGLHIGRRGTELLMLDICGSKRLSLSRPHAWPEPGAVFGFLREGLAEFQSLLPPAIWARVAGIGIAAPFELWNWHQSVGAPEGAMEAWRGLDYAREVAKFSPLPVLSENDVTAATRAEHMFGCGPELTDFAYFNVGAFVGGGVVLNDSVYEGRSGNAGAFGSLPIGGHSGQGGPVQLIDRASIYLLENALEAAGRLKGPMTADPADWEGIDPWLLPWMATCAEGLAWGCVAVASVIDFPAVVIDGAMPPAVRSRLVKMTRTALASHDGRGIAMPRIVEGRLGPDAGATGAATLPIFAQRLLNTHAARL